MFSFIKISRKPQFEKNLQSTTHKAIYEIVRYSHDYAVIEKKFGLCNNIIREPKYFSSPPLVLTFYYFLTQLPDGFCTYNMR